MAGARWSWRSGAVLGAVLLAVAGSVQARSDSGQQLAVAPLDPDPLLRFLPRDDIFMQVPGGKSALRFDAEIQGDVEEDAASRNGGLVVGYCLKSSCSHVTHLAVLQVCANRIGGPDDTNRLILGVVKLPYGDTPGHLLTLQGRDYAANFARNGAHTEAVTGAFAQDNSAVYQLWTEGMGPVQPMRYEGLQAAPVQDGDTLAIRMMLVRDPERGLVFPRLEVRHLCNRQLS